MNQYPSIQCDFRLFQLQRYVSCLSLTIRLTGT
jgi:hypothetical protein